MERGWPAWRSALLRHQLCSVLRRLPLLYPPPPTLSRLPKPREPGKPLFVTLMVYLNPEWREEWFAETILGDPETGSGVFVQPRPGR